MTMAPQLEAMVAMGLMTEADAQAVDAWAEELAQAFTAGEITEAEKDRRIIARLNADLARRGQS